MAQKEIYTDYSFELVSQVKNYRVHNLTTTQRGTLAGTLGAGNIGLHVYDTTEKLPYYWDGTQFIPASPAIQGAMVYKGSISNASTAPSTPAVGYTYVWTGASSTLTWAGQTFNPDTSVQPGDQIIYRGSDVWDIFQADLNAASETEAGYIEIATQAETNAGTDDTRAVTPAKLNGYRVAKALASVYFANTVSVTALTPFTVTHNLNLQNKDAYVISVKNTDSSEITLDVDSVDGNTLTITSAVSLTGLKICVIGF